MEGSREQFSALYEATYPAVLRYARRRVEGDVSFDVVSEVFMIAWRRLDEVPSVYELPWLYGVARRVIANQRRGAGRAVRLAERVAVSAGTTSSAGDPADQVAESMGVAAAFAELSTADREVLALVVWEGLGARDVARVLDCSVAAVAARLSRARRRLRVNLARHGQEGD